MGLELRRDKNHNLRSKWWYGRFMVNGKRHFTNLGVEVKGKAPKNLRERGNTAFECSRTLATAKLRDLVAEAQSQKTATHHLEELYEIKSGESLRQIALAEMEQAWLNLPVRRKRSALWEKNQCATLRKFRCHIQDNYPSVQYLSQITPQMVLSWLRSLDDKKYAPATYNDKMKLLKRFFGKLGPEAGVIKNPFAGIPARDCETIHHQPFTQDELNAILQHSDGPIHSILLVGMCTGMRLGDCCQMKWDEVDLDAGFLMVKTSKTGEFAEIPLFPVLRAEIEAQPQVSQHVFPEAAALYQKRNFGISWRLRQVFKDAGIETKQVCEDRLQDATIKGFHSLRTTWITMALSAGVPMELVRRVTGHSTVEVVLKHYFRPGREAFRAALGTALPKVLTGGPQEKKDTPHDQIAWLLEHGDELDKAAILKKLAEIEPELAA